MLRAMNFNISTLHALAHAFSRIKLIQMKIDFFFVLFSNDPKGKVFAVPYKSFDFFNGYTLNLSESEILKCGDDLVFHIVILRR